MEVTSKTYQSWVSLMLVVFCVILGFINIKTKQYIENYIKSIRLGSVHIELANYARHVCLTVKLS